MSAMVIGKTEAALPGSTEQIWLDFMLCASSLLVLALGAGNLIVCMRNRMATAKVLADSLRNASKGAKNTTTVQIDEPDKADEKAAFSSSVMPPMSAT